MLVVKVTHAPFAVVRFCQKVSLDVNFELVFSIVFIVMSGTNVTMWETLMIQYNIANSMCGETHLYVAHSY